MAERVCSLLAVQYVNAPSSLHYLQAAPLSRDPVLNRGGGHRAEPELDRLSTILRPFNDHFGDVQWEDADRVRQLIIETIPERVREDTAFRNAQRNSDRKNAPASSTTGRCCA